MMTRPSKGFFLSTVPLPPTYVAYRVSPDGTTVMAKRKAGDPATTTGRLEVMRSRFWVWPSSTAGMFTRDRRMAGHYFLSVVCPLSPELSRLSLSRKKLG